MQYHTADGQRISNLGQKIFEAVSEHVSALSLTFQIADISRPLTSVGELADAGSVVVFGRKRGCVPKVDSGKRLDFKREQGCICFALGSRSERSQVFGRQG